SLIVGGAMHIPDGFVSTELSVAAFAISGLAAAVSLKKAGKDLGEKQVPLLGVTAAFVFAAQMMNFPVLGGTSGHFMGAVLASVLLGPLNAFIVMLLVLSIQCFGFADGGLTALGLNVFNMGFIGGIIGYCIFRGILAVSGKSKTGYAFAVGAASWLSIVLVSSVCAFEIALSGTAPLKVVLPAMAGVHALIGFGEAVITVSVVSLVAGVRPDMLHTRIAEAQA
nr:energy-coupling factor ABC transporter permease [bacterium]